MEPFSSLWGYCGACERWRCSEHWVRGGDGPACPECGSPPVLMERLEDGKTVLRLNLEVAVGPVGDRSFLPE
jgi:hypothetical protein